MTAEERDGKTMLATHVEPDLADAFRRVAASNDRRVAAELRVLIRQHVEQNGKKGKRK